MEPTKYEWTEVAASFSLSPDYFEGREVGVYKPSRWLWLSNALVGLSEKLEAASAYLARPRKVGSRPMTERDIFGA